MAHSNRQDSEPDLKAAHETWLADFNARRRRKTTPHADELEPAFTYRRWTKPTKIDLALLEAERDADAEHHDTLEDVEVLEGEQAPPRSGVRTFGLGVERVLLAAGAVGAGYLFGKWWSGRADAAPQRVTVRQTAVHGDEYERATITRQGDEEGDEYIEIPSWAVT